MKQTKFEYNSLLFLLARPLFLGFGIYKIINDAGAYYWISIILGILLGLILNQIYKSLSNVKVLNKIISIILLVYCFYSLTSAVSTLYLNQTPKIIILGALLLVVIYSRSKTEYTILKLANIFFIINISLFIFTILSLVPFINYQNFEFTNNFSIFKILSSAIYFGFLSTLPYITVPDFKKSYNSKIYLLSTIYTLILFTLIIGILGVPVASIYKYPEYIIFKKISILNVIENIQNLLFMSWIFEVFTLLGITSNNIKKKTLIFLLILMFINLYYIYN